MPNTKDFKFPTNQLTDRGHNLLSFAQKNPATFSLSTVAITTGVATIIVPIAVGFGPAGPIAGSAAAAWMSAIGSVEAGSFFAVLQSLAMTGELTAVGGGLIGVGVSGLVGGEVWTRNVERWAGEDWGKAGDAVRVEWEKSIEWVGSVGSVGRDIEEGVKEAWRQVEEGAKGVGRGVAEVTQGMDRGFQEWTENVGKGLDEAGRNMGQGFEEVGKNMGQGFEQFRRSLWW